MNRTGMKAVPFITMRYVGEGLNAGDVQCSSHDRHPRYPIAIKVRQDCDLLVPGDCAKDSFSGGLDAGNV